MSCGVLLMSRTSKKVDKAVAVAISTEARNTIKAMDNDLPWEEQTSMMKPTEELTDLISLGTLPTTKGKEPDVHKLFTYKDGRLHRKFITNVKQQLGQEVGYSDKDGYRRCEIDGISYGVHRLIWLYHKGYLPKEIDHINRIKDDNRVENLREVTHSENLQNVGIKSNNTSGVLGVSFDKVKGKYIARVTVAGKVHRLGTFDDINVADEVVRNARKALHTHTSDVVEPWTCCPDVWPTKAKFFQWMRGQMRRAWSRHPVKVSYMANHRERVPLGRVTTKNPTGLVWGCKCEHCGTLKRQTECEVDHIEAAGSFKGWEDFEAWMMKLMHINWDSIRVVCNECHRIISYAERTGKTFEEAKLEKEAIAFSKLSVVKQCDILELALGYDKAARASNAKLRRALFTKHLQESNDA